MVKYLATKLRPGRGFAHLFHLSFLAFLPIVVLILVRLNFDAIALAVILLSKWRMFAVQRRYWLSHLRTNAVDIIVNVGLLVFITQTNSLVWQLIWVLVYEIWLLVIKPATTARMVSVQAILAQFLGLTSVFLAFEEGSLALYVLLYWAITYFSARHFFASFDEPHAKLYSAVWGLFGASLMWVLGHWLLFVGYVGQPAIILSVVGYGLGALYYLSETKRLSDFTRKQILLFCLALLIVIIVFSDWGDKAV